jgi:signal transduction histidine kinase/DNA-binding response OmpR family regulator
LTKRTSENERVLVLAPSRADAELSSTILADAGLPCRVCRDLVELANELDAGAGAVLVTEDVFVAADAHHFLDALRRQPPWSDIPVLFLSGAGADSVGAAWAIELLGNVTVLERPVRVTTLISALRTAIRARRRQYELRYQFVDLKQAQASLLRQGERQRLLTEAAAVLLTSDDPDTMMRVLFEKIAPHFALDAYFNFAVNERGDALQLESYAGITDDEACEIKRVEFGDSICGSVALNREAMIVSRVQSSEAPQLQWEKRFGLRVYACHPLIAEDRLLGTLSFASRQRDQFDDDEVAVLRTISHYVMVAYERIRLIRELKEGDRRKDEFLATLAHELRNPLAPIRNSLHVMRLAGGDQGVLEQAHSMMARQLSQMVRLIDDLLDVSRITRGKLDLRKERVELASVINMAVDTTRLLIETSGHALTITLPPEPIYLDADPMRLAQVFSNLLNNAAKYMDRGGRIWLSAVPNGAQVVVSVRDVGIGIPREALPTVFEMFSQVDHALEKSQGGLGIGLTLVKRLVEMHGGSVEARSDGPGKGSEFITRLPSATRRSSVRAAAADTRSKGDNFAYRILVADDNRDAADSMSMMLRLMGNEVRTVHDGAEAVKEATEFRPDMALIDIGMPRLNGYDVARAIRQQRWGTSMLLVAMTGWGQEEDKRRAMEAGFDQHFTKPVDPAALERLIRDMPARSAGRQPLAR